LDVASPVAGQVFHRGPGRQQSERNVDEEHRPPGVPEEVQRHQGAADDRADQRGRAHHRAEEPERFGQLVGRKYFADHPQALGDHHRPGETLHQPCGHEHASVGGQPTRSGCGGESDHPNKEHPAPPEEITEPTTRQQTDGQRERIPPDDPLERG
jgi:hypothetical protein